MSLSVPVEIPDEPMSARKYVSNLLLTHAIESRAEFIVRTVIGVLIILSVSCVILDTEPYFKQYHVPFRIIEYTAAIVFTIEYLLKLWCCVELPRFAKGKPVGDRLRYMMTLFAVIDLVAILPFFLVHSGLEVFLSFRALMLLRIVRILKFGQYSKSMGLILHVLRNKRKDIAMSLFIVVVLLIISSSIMYYAEHTAQPEAFKSIPRAMWWGIATLLTIGYGDIYPVTVAGKICTGIISMLGISIVAIPPGIIVSGFIEELQHRKQHLHCPNCGHDLHAHTHGHANHH
jgi:voltage-gated potassium channel